MKTIYDLGLHESTLINDGNIEVMRVAGGWNYIHYKRELDSFSGDIDYVKHACVFVPFDNEFMNAKQEKK